MAEGPIDLIRLEGEGNSVILRITGKESIQTGSEVLVGEVLVDTAFVRGSQRTWVFAEDLWEWRDALDGLDAGHEIAWREYTRAPEMFIERDQDQERANVTIKDHSMSMTTVTVTVSMADSWFDDAYERLDLVMKTWPLGKN
ncbi:DUF5959 family protein [Actinophytocola sp.]|uniref:DUF5959 family protein n=1 Tax=Actinophytocola sp. TaxID=1872138 RepID=UPI002ED62281